MNPSDFKIIEFLSDASGHEIILLFILLILIKDIVVPLISYIIYQTNGYKRPRLIVTRYHAYEKLERLEEEIEKLQKIVEKCPKISGDDDYGIGR